MYPVIPFIIPMIHFLGMLLSILQLPMLAWLV